MKSGVHVFWKIKAYSTTGYSLNSINNFKNLKIWSLRCVVLKNSKIISIPIPKSELY